MSAWSILGIEPTADTALIRRAYARRLKEMRPELDPDAFQRLRDARATALDAAVHFEDPRTNERDAPEPTFTTVDRPMPAEAIEPLTTQVRANASDLFSETREAEERRSVVVEVAPLAETGEHWIAAEQLKPAIDECLAPLDVKKGVVDTGAFARLVGRAAMLPRRPRRDVERACIAALTRAWRSDDGRFDRRRVARITPLLSIADTTFGWSGDDSILNATLSPQDVDALSLLLDVAARRPAAKSPAALRLRRADVLAYFWQSPQDRALYDRVLSRGKMPWKVHWFALLAPHVWALYRRLWVEAAVIYAAMGFPAVLLMASGSRPPNVAVICAVALFVMTLVTVGLFADRIIFAAALRATHRADALCLFDRSKREVYLNAKGGPASRMLFVLLVVALTFVLFPYSVLIFMVPMLGMGS